METGEVIEEEYYDYNGPIAECKGGGGSTVTYTQSPEQAQIYRIISPVIGRIAQRALGPSNLFSSTPGMYGSVTSRVKIPGIPFRVPRLAVYNANRLKQFLTPASQQDSEYKQQVEDRLWDVPPAPPAPVMPSMRGVLTGVPPYAIPSPEFIMPTQAWWTSLSPHVKAGLWQPWNEAARQMMETMGATGQLGSARGGYAGTGERALGELYSRAGKDVGLQAWKMTAPGALMGWQELLTRGKKGYQEALQEALADYESEVRRRQADYSTGLTRWGEEIEEAKYPYAVIPGLLGGTYSQGVVQPNAPSPWPGIGGAVGGGLAGYGVASGLGLTGSAMLSPIAFGTLMGASLLGGGK